MNIPGCDPRALRIAETLHRTEQPDITVLFGSRARGDYQEQRSDIDIMLVQELPPTGEQRARAFASAEKSAETLYRRRVPVQILWKTSAEFHRMRRSVNDVVANALKDGIVMSQDPDKLPPLYRDTENQKDAEDYAIEWSVTEERIRQSEKNLTTFNILVQANDDDDMIGMHAQRAMEHALKALISANQESYPHVHRIDQLTDHALRSDPGLEFHPSIDGAIYNQYAGRDDYYATETPISGIGNYRERVNADVRLILDRVQEIKGAR